MSSIFERTQVELVSDWLIVGAKQGKKAPFDRLLRTGEAPRTLCADEFGLLPVESQGESIICFAVADGVSSERYADVGASGAVKQAIHTMADECRSGFPEQAELERVLESVHRHLITFAEERNIAPSTLSTTLLLGALDVRTARLACANIGDAFVVAQTDEKTWHFPPLDNFDPNATTYSVTDTSWAKLARYEECPFRPSTIIAFTDGLRHVMFKVDRVSHQQNITPYADAIDVFRQAIMHSDNASRGRAVAALLGVAEDRKLMEDDRTVLILQNVRTAERNLTREQKWLAPSAIPASMNVERQQHDKILPERTQVAASQIPSASENTSFGALDRKLSILIGLVLTSLLLLLLLVWLIPN